MFIKLLLLIVKKSENNFTTLLCITKVMFNKEVMQIRIQKYNLFLLR